LRCPHSRTGIVLIEEEHVIISRIS
jgi:hypothetical protein